MASATVDLINGRKARLTCNYVSTDIAGNRTKWSWKAEFINSGGVWGDGNEWRLRGFAIKSWADFYIPSGSSTILLGEGEFWKYHEPDGTYDTENFYLDIASTNPYVGNGTATLAISPPLIPRGPRVRYNGTWRNTVAYAKVSGTWKTVVPYANVSGTWKVGGA